MKLFLLFCVIIGAIAVCYVKVSSNNPQNNTQNYQIVRDTIYFDRSRYRDMTAHEYQLELEQDSIFIYDGQRLVKVIHADSSINEVLINDNL